jgi:hypothetical protein
MFFKNTGIFYYLKKNQRMISILLGYSRTDKHQTKKRALPALHKKEDFFYKYRFFRNQSACGGR